MHIIFKSRRNFTRVTTRHISDQLKCENTVLPHVGRYVRGYYYSIANGRSPCSPIRFIFPPRLLSFSLIPAFLTNQTSKVRFVRRLKFVARPRAEILIDSLRVRFAAPTTPARKMRFTLDLCPSFLITASYQPLRKLARGFSFRGPLMYCSLASREGAEES